MSLRGALAVAILLAQAAICRGEYPALQAALASAADQLAAEVEGKRTIVYVRDLASRDLPWRVRGALQAELIASLRSREVDAVPAEREPTFAWLADESKAKFAAGLARWKRTPGFDALVLGQLESRKDGLRADLAVYFREKPRVAKRLNVSFDAKALSLAANIPDLNRKVLEFVRQRFGQRIGDGECSNAATEALKSAGAERPGIYHWGRQLAEGEAFLPGDIVQFEAAKFVGKNGKVYAGFPHHTAIIEEVTSPRAVGVLQQNVGPAGKTISRAPLDFSDLQSGVVAIFRPTDGKSPLPITLLPRRREPAAIVKDASKRIDLLETIDPYLDAVHGIWHFVDGELTCHRETFARLQIPLDLPDSYSIQAIVKREAGQDQLGFGLVVGGRQVMLVLDSYGGTVAGLHLLDGKKANANPTSLRKVLLPLEATVRLEVRVTPNSVELSVDGQPTYKWVGDPGRLSVQPEWQVPRTDWLFLTSYHSYFRIKSLTLTP
jgi:hypothetical protein